MVLTFVVIEIYFINCEILFTKNHIKEFNMLKSTKETIKKDDPKILIIPSIFRNTQEEEERWMLKSILLFNPVWHSMSLYDVPKDPELHDDTYKSIRKTREFIVENLEYYEIINFNNITGIVKSEHISEINKLLSEIKENPEIEKDLFGKKYNLFETAMGANRKDNFSPNCWIFLEKNFILFESNENYKKAIKDFFFG